MQELRPPGRLTAAAAGAAAVGAAVAVLAACVHYAPRPHSPERALAQFTQRTLADPQLRALLERQLPGRAADWPRRQWDRADLWVAMLCFNDELTAARAAARGALAARRTARERPNPSVTLMTEYANQHDGSPLWLWALASDWLLDAGTRRGARIALADLKSQRACFELAELAWRQRGALRRALAELLISERELRLRAAVQSDREAQLDMARRRVEAGAAARPDLDRLVRDALQDEQQLHQSRQRSSRAYSALAAALGVPVGALEGLDLTWERLDDPPDVGATLLQSARENALLERSDVHGAVAAYGIAEQALRLEVARQYPDVHLGPSYTWDHGVRRYQFNLGLTLPLLNLNAGPVAEAEAQREEAGARLEATVARAWQEIDEAIRQWQLARARLTEARGPVYEAAQRLYAATARGFEAGSNDRTELVAARLAQTLSELEVLDAVRTAQEALGGLEDALRRPLEGPELALNEGGKP